MYDYTIVGAGSAGCVLAHRLSEDPATRVLLLEAGRDERLREIAIPAGWIKLFKADCDWAYGTEANPGLDGRRLFVPRGKMLGGSSSMNLMIYLRGHRADFDEWAAAGNTGWHFEEVLHYFKRSENNSRGASEFHGTGGPLAVSDIGRPNELSLAFVEAATAVGLSRNHDFNGATQDGAGLVQVTMNRGRAGAAPPTPSCVRFSGGRTSPSSPAATPRGSSSRAGAPRASSTYGMATKRSLGPTARCSCAVERWTREHGFTIAAILLKPRSRGHVTLRSADPLDPPVIHSNHFSDPEGWDLRTVVEGVRIARRIAAARPLASLSIEESFPGAAATSDDDLSVATRAEGQTAWHPAGTCKMGTDPMAVVDPELHVRGIEGLRVVDASVLPTMIRGHTNAPVIMIAEKAADLIRGLAPAGVPVADDVAAAGDDLPPT